ncbi:EpsD family peptidyl-prolyl cis-trans isomerase [Methylobacillus glycogenes]|uniref:EpsD family peptidyl-prolyl cis-trans isomerase n=1 Tax=Methylobacillus glycogenes TaxID=406 RepID=UPI00046F5699|nr:EpsD family peptidyl-prolyl cis-trans isomerase [Methylobacillus glycogenes]
MNNGFVTNFKQSRTLCVGAVIVLAFALSGCGDKHESKASQSLVKVNGKEITVHQLNQELGRANIQENQREQATQQILTALIDRQLLEEAALKAKVDRDPNVMTTIERAKSQIIAQAYLQSKLGSVAKPSKTEIENFYNENPQFFSKRRMVEMDQLLIDTKFANDELKTALGKLKTLQEVAAWMDAHNIQYDQGQVSRSVAELPPQISERLKAEDKGKLFVIGMGPRTMLIMMNEIKDSPVSLAEATPQIENNLLNKARKEVAENEVKRLKADAKIEYIDKKMETATETKAAKKKPSSTEDDIASGVSGLK